MTRGTPSLLLILPFALTAACGGPGKGPNEVVANAALPLDMFSATPDYTPYTYAPRTSPLTCGIKGTHAEQRLTASWTFDDADAQPGLDAQVTRWLRGRQLTELTPGTEREIVEREARRARRETREEP